MNLLIGKKQIILAGLVVALGLAVFINWYYSGSGTELLPGGSKKNESVTDSGAAQYVSGLSDEEYFASVRMNRDNARGDAMEELKAVLSDAADDSSAASDTAKAIEKLTNEGKMENDIENLVTGKLGTACVAVISDNCVEVVVNNSALNDSNVLTISDVIDRICGGQYENVRVSGTGNN